MVVNCATREGKYIMSFSWEIIVPQAENTLHNTVGHIVCLPVESSFLTNTVFVPFLPKALSLSL